MANTSFPRCNVFSTPEMGPESFIRSMFPLGHGYPIWEPIGDTSRPASHLRDGVRIGDVGLITRDGEFRYCFNIFLPATDPIQYQSPPDLEPLHPPPTPSEIVGNPMHFPPGTALVSKGVSVTRHSESPLDLEFTLNAREGAMMIFPDGASREDLSSTTRLLPYVRKHALSWYCFINAPLSSSPHPNGSLYLVTGRDSTNASSWGIASAAQYLEARGREIKTHYRRENPKRWAYSHAAMCRSDIVSNPGATKCTMFIRGMRIAVNPSSWTKYILLNEPLAHVPHFNVLSTPNVGFRAKIATMIERWKGFPDQYRAVTTEIMFHPSSILCRILFDESPTAAVAIAEDSLWSSTTDKWNDGTLPEIVKQIAKLLDTHDISTVEGLVTLVPKNQNSVDEAPHTQNALLRLPDRVRNVLVSRRRHQEILQKIAKALPGPQEPLTQ